MKSFCIKLFVFWGVVVIFFPEVCILKIKEDNRYKKDDILLKLKEVTIFEGENYRIEDFISLCKIDGEEVCSFSYANKDMNDFKKAGKYNIIILIHYLDTEYQQSTNLIIKKRKTKKKKILKKENTTLQKTEVTSVSFPDKENNEILTTILDLKMENHESINEILKNVNDYRKEMGDLCLQPLVLDDGLTTLAFARALEMSRVNFLSHIRPNSKPFYTVFDDFDIKMGQFVGENIASGFFSAHSVSLAWKNSIPHYKNIINASFTKIGIGISCIDNTCYWVQLFSSSV